MIASMLLGAGVTLGVVLLWVAVQRFAVRNSPELPPDCDMLQVSHRCHGCNRRESCLGGRDEHQAGPGETGTERDD